MVYKVVYIKHFVCETEMFHRRGAFFLWERLPMEFSLIKNVQTCGKIYQ